MTNKSKLKPTQPEESIKYCVCAFIDLIGISSHYEVGRDLRTNIGSELIERLRSMENALVKIRAEKKSNSEFYDEEIKFRRINDSLIITLDLDKTLLPDIDSTSPNFFFDINEAVQINKDDTIVNALRSQEQKKLIPLLKFVGLVARIHTYINEIERKNHFPGAKTVISSGYRKPFRKDDVLSANFAFANAYKAESVLKESKFYIENSVLQMISHNRYSKNISQFGCLIRRLNQFNPFNEEHNYNTTTEGYYDLSKEISVELFRRKYVFRELNPNPIIYLQLLDQIIPIFDNAELKERKDWFADILRDIASGVSDKDIEKRLSHLILFWKINLDMPLKNLLYPLQFGEMSQKE